MKVVALSEALATLRALIRPLSGVNALVGQEVTPLLKTLATLRAVMRLLSDALERTLLSETRLALNIFLHLHMRRVKEERRYLLTTGDCYGRHGYTFFLL